MVHVCKRIRLVYQRTAYLQSAEEAQMLFNGQPIEEHIVLGTDAQTVTNLVHVRQNTVAIDSSISRGRGEQPWRAGSAWKNDAHTHTTDWYMYTLQP